MADREAIQGDHPVADSTPDFDGGEASTEATTYRSVAIRHLSAEAPEFTYHVDVAAVGGSNSSDWLGADPRCDWTQISRLGVDPAGVEFVNGARVDPSRWERNYLELLRRFQAQRCALILMSPPFTMPSMMGDAQRRGLDRRPYTQSLRSVASRNGVPLLDLPAVWERWERSVCRTGRSSPTESITRTTEAMN